MSLVITAIPFGGIPETWASYSIAIRTELEGAQLSGQQFIEISRDFERRFVISLIYREEGGF